MATFTPPIAFPLRPFTAFAFFGIARSFISYGQTILTVWANKFDEMRTCFSGANRFGFFFSLSKESRFRSVVPFCPHSFPLEAYAHCLHPLFARHDNRHPGTEPFDRLVGTRPHLERLQVVVSRDFRSLLCRIRSQIFQIVNSDIHLAPIKSGDARFQYLPFDKLRQKVFANVKSDP